MKAYIVTAIGSVTLLLCTLTVTNAYKNRNRANDIINVTGLAKKDFESDLIVWKGSFVQRSLEMKSAFENLQRDAQMIKQFIENKGLKDEQAVFSSVQIDKEYESFDESIPGRGESTLKTTRRFKGYLLTQYVQIESLNVDKVEAFSREVTGLINSGIEFYSQAPEYYYTKLGELKIEMIAAATKDGRVRAERIVENAGGKIGKLRFSNLGVFQITAPNSSAENSWDGAFDRRSKKKSASITIKLQFGLE